MLTRAELIRGIGCGGISLAGATRRSWWRKGVSQKFLTQVRIQRPAAACMFKFNPRGRVLVRPRASALPGSVAAAPIARSARTLRSHWRADRRVGRLSQRSRPHPPRRRFAPEVWDGTEPIPPAGKETSQKFVTGFAPFDSQGKGSESKRDQGLIIDFSTPLLPRTDFWNL